MGIYQKNVLFLRTYIQVQRHLDTGFTFERHSFLCLLPLLKLASTLLSGHLFCTNNYLVTKHQISRHSSSIVSANQVQSSVQSHAPILLLRCGNYLSTVVMSIQYLAAWCAIYTREGCETINLAMVERALVMVLGLFGGSLVVCLRDSASETIVPVPPLHCKSSMVNSAVDTMLMCTTCLQ